MIGMIGYGVDGTARNDGHLLRDDSDGSGVTGQCR